MIRMLIFLVLLLPFSTSADKSLEAISFVAFGDSGYHYDYIKQDVLDEPLTLEEYYQTEHDEWLEKYLPPGEFKAPPVYIRPETGYAIQASGAIPVAKAMGRYCATHDCQFGIMLGDNIYPNGATGKDDEIRFKKIFEEPYKKLVNHRTGFKLYAALGNHDWKTSRVGRNRQIEFGMRKETALTIKQPGYYSYRKGDVEFFVIDTNLLLAGTVVKEDELNPDGSESPTDEIDVPEKWELPNREDKKQTLWLTSSLKNSKAKWKIVYGHHTLWSAGGGKFEEARALRSLIMDSVCKYADVYVAGHEHELEVNMDTCRKQLGTSEHPLPLVVSGAGAWQRPVHHPFQEHQKAKYPQYKTFWSKGMVWGFAHFRIQGNDMIVKMITTPDNDSGQVNLEKTLRFPNRSQRI